MRDGQRIGFQRRVRPLRVGYRVDPQSAQDVLRAIETATGQWGGRFHPLIPTFKRRPRWWLTPFGPNPTARQIEASFVTAFECDYVVEARSGAIERPSYRTVTLEMLRRVSGSGGVEAGLPAVAIWSDYWSHEHRFRPEGSPSIVTPIAQKGFRLFCAACFGEVSDGKAEGDPRGAFVEAFAPLTPTFDMETLLDAFPETAARPSATLLSLGSWRLEARRRVWEPRPLKIMLVDPCSAPEVVDYWNLRATGASVVPIPAVWLDGIAPLLAGRLLADRTSHDGTWIEVIGARRTPAAVVAAFAARLHELGLDVVTAWYPRVEDGLSPALVTEREDEVEETVRNGRITLGLLAPRAASHYQDGYRRWTNLVGNSPWRVPSDGSVAALIPPELGQVRDLFGAFSPLGMRATTEGVAIPSGQHQETVDIELPSGRDVLAAFFRLNGFDPSRSDPGSIAERLISQAGGLHMTAVFRHWNLLNLLNSAARSEAVVLDRDRTGTRQGLRASFFKAGELREALNRDLETDVQKDNVTRTLVDREIIRAGLTLKCDECGYTNWLELDSIRPTMACARCLQQFPFPHASPPERDRWAYRPTGACSVPDFATGSYTVALAVRFLMPDSRRMTWCTGTQLTSGLEVDFAAVREDRGSQDAYQGALILGEAKSMNRFTAQDFARAERLRERFPDATLAFTTLKEELTPDEKIGIARLARPVWRRPEDVHRHARVLVLTRRELLSLEGAPQCWAGSAFAEHSPSWVHGRSELAQWSDVTQQLYLDLQPHDEWARTEYDRLARRARSTRRGSSAA